MSDAKPPVDGLTSIFDIDTVTGSEEGAWLHFEHPVTGEPLYAKGKPVRWLIMGVDGKDYQKLQRRIQAKRTAALVHNRGNDKTEGELDEALNIELLSGATLAWEGMHEKDGTEIPWSVKNAARMLRQVPWMVDQVNPFIVQRANFIKSSSAKT